MPYPKVLGNKMFPHIVVLVQWLSLVMLISLNLNFSFFATGAVTLGGFKVIMVYHLLFVFLSILSSFFFYRVRKEGMVEKCIFGLSVLASLIGFLNICLNFVNDFVYLMKGAELVAWSMYNIIFSLSTYKILTVLIAYIKRGFTWSKVGSDDENFQTQGQEWTAKNGHR